MWSNSNTNKLTYPKYFLNKKVFPENVKKIIMCSHNLTMIKYKMFTVVLFCRRDIYRLNLELGQFLNSFESEGSEVNKVAINPCHQLVVVGTREGRVEAWDPRTRGRVGVLDCALSSVTPDTTPESVTNLFNLSSKTCILFLVFIHIQYTLSKWY